MTENRRRYGTQIVSYHQDHSAASMFLAPLSRTRACLSILYMFFLFDAAIPYSKSRWGTYHTECTLVMPRTWLIKGPNKDRTKQREFTHYYFINFILFGAFRIFCAHFFSRIDWLILSKPKSSFVLFTFTCVSSQSFTAHAFIPDSVLILVCFVCSFFVCVRFGFDEIRKKPNRNENGMITKGEERKTIRQINWLRHIKIGRETKWTKWNSKPEGDGKNEIGFSLYFPFLFEKKIRPIIWMVR